jgi:hypothetical protein
MALLAKALHISEKEILPFGGMGLMAVQTTHLVNDGPVNPVFVERLVHHLAVAPTAQLKPCFFGLQRVGRRGSLMALSTNFIGNRLVNIVVQNPSFTRPVSVMAGGTVGLRHRVIHMLFLKVGPICLVAADT